MTLKDSVRLDGLTAPMALAAQVVESVYRALGVECVVTSADDSTHTGRPVAGDSKDPHYCGKALDFRIKTVPHDQRAGLAEAIQLKLGPTFLVKHEGIDTDREHVHVQHGYPA